MYVCIVLSYLNNYCSHLSCKLCEHKVCVNIILYVSVKKFVFNGQIVCFRQQTIGSLDVIS